MKKISVYANLDWIQGYLRYGHVEGDLELTDEEFEDFKKNPKPYLYDLSIVIDDYRIEDYGEYTDIEWKEE